MKRNRLLTMVCVCALAAGALQAPLVCAEEAEQNAAETKPQISQDTLYTITYIRDGGVGRIDENEPAVKSTKMLISPWALRKDGYSHYAWTDGEHTYRRGETISMPAHDVELRPVWRRTFKVTYEKLEKKYKLDSDIRFGNTYEFFSKFLASFAPGIMLAAITISYIISVRKTHTFQSAGLIRSRSTILPVTLKVLSDLLIT